MDRTTLGEFVEIILALIQIRLLKCTNPQTIGLGIITSVCGDFQRLLFLPALRLALLFRAFLSVAVLRAERELLSPLFLDGKSLLS